MQYSIEVINAQRSNISLIIKTNGFLVDLFIPLVAPTGHTMDVYNEHGDTAAVEVASFRRVDASVFIEWSPSMRRLQNLGYYVEGELPIIAWITWDQPEIIATGSYMKVPIQHVPDLYKTDQFELVDQVVKNAYNATVAQLWHIAPRRKV